MFKESFKKIEDIDLGKLAKNLNIAIYLDETDEYIFKMPVEGNTQPFGRLSGGASAALAETVGSFAANYYALKFDKIAVGTELNISHLKSNNSNFVYAKYAELKTGRTLSVHEIKIFNPDSSLVSVARITNFLIENKK